MLRLGRMLAAEVEAHDTLGQWMSWQLAALVAEAEATEDLEPGQRQAIVDLILKIWALRGDLPRGGPLNEYSAVLEALDYLADENPWRFFRIPVDAAKHERFVESGSQLAAAACVLERVSRETAIQLLWMAAQRAELKTEDWSEIADAIGPSIEQTATRRLGALRRAIEASQPNSEAVNSATEDLRRPAELDDDGPEDETVLKLRAMATLLNGIADGLSDDDAADDVEGAAEG